MHRIFALIVLFFGIHATAQDKQLSPKARELTQALAALRSNPSASTAQERDLKTFPHDYKEFLNLFDLNHELYDGHDFVDALSLAGKGHETELGNLLVGLASFCRETQNTTSKKAFVHFSYYFSLDEYMCSVAHIHL